MRLCRSVQIRLKYISSDRSYFIIIIIIIFSHLSIDTAAFYESPLLQCVAVLCFGKYLDLYSPCREKTLCGQRGPSSAYTSAVSSGLLQPAYMFTGKKRHISSCNKDYPDALANLGFCCSHMYRSHLVTWRCQL